VNENGRGLICSSSATLSGRKLFAWGDTIGGRHWMDFLSCKDQRNYVEIQSGLTPTQLHTRPLPALSILEWGESFSPLILNVNQALNPDYHISCREAEAYLVESIPDETLSEMDSFLASQSDSPIQEILHQGANWGWLHETLTGRKISPGLNFKRETLTEEAPWAELLFYRHLL